MAEITPTFMMTMQSNMNVRFSNAWSRILPQLWWDKVAIRDTASTLEEFYEWMLETAQIRPTGTSGDELDFEDIVAVSHRIKSENFGTALRLSRNSIEDNKYDRAAKWSADAGGASAYWPQRQIVSLIQQGKTNKGYDGKTFFASDHPVNPYDAASGSYGNLFTGKPLTSTNLAAVVAEILKVRHPGDAPRYLKPSLLLVDPSNQLAAQTITNAEIITDALTLGTNRAATATNMIKRAYSFGQPVVVPEFSSEAGVWYVGCEADEDALNGAFVYQERKPFELDSFTGLTQADLNRLNVFEWHLRGRNTSAYGHPYLFYRVEPT
jgi:phage major head subunit gpT-like protein